MAESRLDRIAKLGGLGTKVASMRLGDAIRGKARKARRARAAEEISETLSQLKGAAMKAGQQLAIAAAALDLPEDVQRSLQKLHKDAAPVPFGQILAVVEDELDARLEDVFGSFERAPIGTASLAQAHAATLPDGQSVVVKVLHKGVLEGLETDILALKGLALGGRMAGRSKTELREVVREIEARLREEVDYLQEAANINTFHQLYGDDPRIIVPSLHADLCTERILVMDRVPGMPIEDFLATASPELQAEVGSNLAELFFEMAFQHRTLHADPHPGNYLFTEDGRIGLLDFGCVKRFDEFFLAQYAAVVLHGLDGDRAATLQAVRDLGCWVGDTPAAGEAIWLFCDEVLGPWRGGVCALDADTTLVDRAKEASNDLWRYPEVRGVGEMLYLHRTLAGLYTLAKPLGPRADWGALLRRHLTRAVETAAGR